MNSKNEIETIEKASITTSQLARLWDLGLDLESDQPSRPNKPVAQIEWVYACLFMIIRTARTIQLVLSTADDEVVESGPAYEFLFNNPDQSYMAFISDTVGYLTLHNEVYWITVDIEGIMPKRILVAGRDTCKPVIRRGVVIGYELKAAEGRRIPLFLEDVYPIIDFNPDNRYGGVGPLDSAKLAISTSYQATLLNEATLANGARIGVVLTVPPGVKLDPDQIARMKSEFAARHGGARNAGLAFLATGGVDVKPFTQTMVELQMLDLRRFDAACICAAFGVPPELVGLNPEAQYAHGPAQQRFMENTVSPMLSYLAYHVTLGILKRFKFDSASRGLSVEKSKSFCGARLPLHSRSCYRREKVKAIQSQSSLFAWFDLTQHPAMQAQQKATAESVLKFTLLGVPLNDLIEAHDLPYRTQAWGNDWWVGMGQVPARFILEGGMESVTGPSQPEEPEDGKQALSVSAGTDDGPVATGRRHGGAGSVSDRVTPVIRATSDEPRRLRLWRSWAGSWLGIEKEYSQSLRMLFINQQRQLISKLRAAMAERALSVSAGVITNDDRRATHDEIIARVVFDLKVEDGKLKVINHTFFLKASELGVRQSLTEVLGLKGEKLTAAAEQAKARPAIKRKLLISARKITKINSDTQERIRDEMIAGLDAGEGLKELTARIADTFKIRLNKAKTIARTQTAGAVGTGRHEGFRFAGLELKTWLSSRDDHVRPAHREAEAKYAAGIPIDSFFVVGGENLMYPGDPSGSAANIINCRCVELAKSAAGKSFDLAVYSSSQFYSYSDMQRDIAAQKESSNAAS